MLLRSVVVIRIGRRHVPFARDAIPSCRVHDKFLVITGAYLRTKYDSSWSGPGINLCRVLYVRYASPGAYCIDDLQSC